jgi:tRNA nucleotidyltransferase/poly(A) polymerase
MTVMVDQQPLAVEELGLSTVGQVLCHVHKGRRLVVSLLIDGEEPDLNRMAAVRQSLVKGRTLFIETADPTQLAGQLLADVSQWMVEAERLRVETAELLQRNEPPAALEKLRGCLTLWQHAQDAVGKVAQLLRVDLGSVQAGDGTIQSLLERFAEQLRQVKAALEQRDFVALSDVLLYEMAENGQRWEQALEALRGSAGGPGR